MIINNQEINIKDLFDERYMHKEIGNGNFLNEYQIQILLKYKIDPYKCVSLKNLMFEIEDVLLEDDFEDLENIAAEIAEFNYYSNTNK